MSHTVMAVNAGSSTIKFQVFSMPSEEVIAKGLVERIGEPEISYSIWFEGRKYEGVRPDIDSFQSAINFSIDALTELNIVSSLDDIRGIGHRVAHGGERFSKATVIDDDVLAEIERISELAPLHNPINVAGIKAVREKLPDRCNVAVFDTAFHHTMTPEHFLYAIPYELYEKHGIRRYGFHGTSHDYVSQVCAEQLGKKRSDMRIISCHLGSGASICAIDHGESVNTSMGFTPLAGLMMGTRSGDIDPSLIGYIGDKLDITTADVNAMLNRESGLLGVSELSNDYRQVEKASLEGNEKATVALDMFVERIRSFIGSYIVQMGGLDALIFTGGIGENSRSARAKVCAGLSGLGISIDSNANESNAPVISDAQSGVTVTVVNTNEELMIAREVWRNL